MYLYELIEDTRHGEGEDWTHQQMIKEVDIAFAKMLEAAGELPNGGRPPESKPECAAVGQDALTAAKVSVGWSQLIPGAAHDAWKPLKHADTRISVEWPRIWLHPTVKPNPDSNLNRNRNPYVTVTLTPGPG